MGKIIFAGLAAFCFSFAGIVLLEVGAAEQEPLSFAPVFADHMVLQRDAEVSVFGYGAEGEKVIVEYDGRTAEGSVENGKWSVRFGPFPASTEGKTLTATSPSGSISVSDVVVGEVWLCSGQSNMELSLQYVGFGEYRSYANVDKIRVADIENGTSPTAQRSFAAPLEWKAPSSLEELGGNSAYAVGFALRLQEGLGEDIPVGIVQSDTSGSAIEEWMNAQSVAETGSIAESMGKIPVERYNSMIYPMLSYTFGGLLWYQGEANAAAPALYAEQFKALVKQYREEFCPMPVISTQLPKYSDSDWPVFRQMQWDTMSEISDSYVVCGIDTGLKADIHPLDKYELSRRAGELALTEIYGKEGYRGLAPYPTQAINDRGVVTISFSGTANGIEVKGTSTEEISGFSLCGEDGVYFEAAARLEGENIIVSSASVSVPVKIRYAWAPVPETPLYSNGNPFAPFEFSVRNEYVNISAYVSEGGRIEGNTGRVVKNLSVMYSLFPEEGYRTDKVLVNGIETEFENNVFTVFSDEDKQIEVTFVPIPRFRVSVGVSEGEGKINAGASSVEENGEVKIYLVPEKGYEIASLKINGRETETDGYIYFVTGITEDIFVEVSFLKMDSGGCSSACSAALLSVIPLLAAGIVIKRKK